MIVKELNVHTKSSNSFEAWWEMQQLQMEKCMEWKMSMNFIERYGEQENIRKKIRGHNLMFNMRIETQTRQWHIV